MDRTELREQFIRQAYTDPYMHLVSKMFADAWADGYEAALRDIQRRVQIEAVTCEIDDIRAERSPADLRSRAIEQLMASEVDARAVMALAKIGQALEWKVTR
jgi:hypothetical protein